MTAQFAAVGNTEFHNSSDELERLAAPVPVAAEHSELVRKWLASESWPRPAWFTNSPSTSRVKDYHSFLVDTIRARYLELEGDFRTVIGNFHSAPGTDLVTAGQIFERLQRCREMLESKNPDLSLAGSMLDSIERYLVWLYPTHIAIARVPWIERRIEQLENSNNKQSLRRQISELTQENPPRLAMLRAVFEEVLAAWNRQMTEKVISGGLQISRLKVLRRWGVILLLALIVITPAMINTEPLGKLELGRVIVRMPPELHSNIAAISLALVGALGGFLSGLLHIRHSYVDLAKYQESILTLHLKVLVGAIVAIVLSILLSWEILAGVSAKTPGAYFVVAFVSGFSERYFLKVLSIDLEADTPTSASKAVKVVPGRVSKSPETSEPSTDLVQR